MLSKNNFLIIHGTENAPRGNWFPWLRDALSVYGNVIAPQFPTPDGQSLNAWNRVADDALRGVSPTDTVLIGHSTGAIQVLRLAEQTPTPYKAIYAVSPFVRALGLPHYDALNASFVESPFNWNAVRAGAHKITCFAGDNDPYVPLDLAKEVATHCAARLEVIPQGGHLNADAGYTQFPLLLTTIIQDMT